jgi:hypothetical protein
MNKLTASYLAGLIDGEGCLDIPVHKEKYFKGRLRITMINKDIILWLKNSYGGIFGEREAYLNNRKSYTWTLEHKKNLYDFLKKVTPYLKVKKEEAIVMLKFFKTFDKAFYVKNGDRIEKVLKNDTLKLRSDYSLEIKRLKRVCSVND